VSLELGGDPNDARNLWIEPNDQARAKTTANSKDADFTVLAELSRAPGNTMRSTQCAHAVGWDTGRLSHQLRRMEERGLIRRGRGTSDDRRAAVVTLTGQGSTAYRKALGPHLRSARRWFLDALTPDQLTHLDDILASVLTHLETPR
jgi:DNA-binding MarR family transcriptional regulator